MQSPRCRPDTISIVSRGDPSLSLTHQQPGRGAPPATRLPDSRTQFTARPPRPPLQVKTAAAGSGALPRLTVTDTECVFIDIAQTQTSLQLLYLQFKCGERGCQYRISALNHSVNCTKAVRSRLCHCNVSCLPDIITGLVIYC